MSDARRDVLIEVVEYAVNQCKAGSLDDAEARLRETNVSLDEAPAVVYFHAAILMALERWEEALARLNALAAVVSEAKVHLGRATCLVNMGRLEDARAVLDQDALRGHFLHHVLLARIAAREGYLAESASLLREACRSDDGGALLVLQSPRLAAIVEGRIRTNTLDQPPARPVQ